MAPHNRVLTFSAVIAALGIIMSLVAYVTVAQQSGNAWPWLAAGVAMTLLVIVALGFIYRDIIFAERQVTIRTAELRDESAARERTEMSAREAVERFQAVIDNAHDAIIAIDARGRMETFNKAAQRIFGYQPDEVLGRNVSMLMSQPYRGEHDGYMRNYLTTGVAKIIGTGREVEAQRKDGTVFPIDLSVGEMRVGDQRGFIGIIRDITGRYEAERQIRQLTADMLHISRLSAMGQLSSSIAHELNQPLTAIMNYVEAARQMLASTPAPPRVAEFMERATGQAERAGQIIRRLRSFVEKGAVERSEEELSKVIEEASALAAIGTKVDGIRLIFELDRGLPPIRIDKVQIQQVVVNLVRNAIEVLRDADNRVLTVRTKLADADRQIDGATQQVEISDTGPGISPDIADQLFKPFVSTKRDGMGIGLSISLSIIGAHGGSLWHEANPGGGTVFKFTLPAVSGEATA
jgi:two-component system sensor kinase FixL